MLELRFSLSLSLLLTIRGPKWEINRASYLDGAVNISARRAQFKLPQDGRAYNAS